MKKECAVPVKKWAIAPTMKEVLALAATCCLLYLAVIAGFSNYWHAVRNFGDNIAYTGTASAIGRWDIASIRIWQFWGLPYAMAAFSFITRTSVWTALLFFSIGSSFVAVFLSDRLWGGWVAGYFAVMSRDWFERTVLGGAEPLFLALVFGSFLAARRQRWLCAALLASLSAVVRPMGIFALAGIGLVLLIQKRYKTLAATVLIGIVVGGLYVTPLKVYQGKALANVHRYGEADGSGGRPVTYPFVELLRRPTAFGSINGIDDVAAGRMTTLNFAWTMLWVVLVTLGVVIMFFNRHFRKLARDHPVELVFCALYCALLFTYNSPWARVAFARYALPILPFVIVAFEPWIPKDRRLLWVFGLGSAVLAAAATIGLGQFIATVHKMF